METATATAPAPSLIALVLKEYGIDPGSVPADRERRATPDTTRQLVKHLLEYGFAPSELIAIARKQPAVLYHTWEYIKPVLEHLELGGISREDIRVMTVRYPTMLNCDPERIDETIEILSYLGVDPRKNPGRFTTSPKLYRGRIAYLNGLTEDASISHVFLTDSAFRMRFGKTREEMVALDPGRDAYRGKTLP